MPHAPINDLKTSLRSLNYDSIHVTGYTEHREGAGWVELGTLQYLAMPETVINPKRPDGTRPVSNYWIKRQFVVLPRLKVKQGVPPYSSWLYRTEGGSCPYSQDLIGTNPTWNASKLLPSWLVVQNVDALARTKFLTKLGERSGKDQVQLGAAAGEVRETIGMASDLGEGIVKGIRSIARNVSQSPKLVAKSLDLIREVGVREAANRVLRGDVRLLERIVEGWLVVQFGLKPLCYDIYDGTVWLSHAQQAETLRLTVKVRGGASSEQDVQIRSCRFGDNGATYDVDAVVRQSVGVHYACDYEIPTKATIPEQLGLYNPATIAWELARFSWMVDYVVDIGGWLNSMMAAQNTRFVEGTKSVIQRAGLVEFRDVSQPPVVPIQGDLDSLGALLQVEDFQRTVLNHGVMPSFLPGIRNKMDLTRLANSMAALTTLVGARSSGGPWHLKP